MLPTGKYTSKARQEPRTLFTVIQKGREMKPDKPGFWHSRKGNFARVWEAYYHNVLWGELFNSRGDRVKGSCRVVDFDEDDWLPVEEPEFPKIPARPLSLNRCLVEWQGREGVKIGWIGNVRDECGWLPPEKRKCGSHYVDLRKCRVIPHEENDRDAVVLVEAAQNG